MTRTENKAMDAILELREFLQMAERAVSRVKSEVAGESRAYADTISHTIRKLRQDSDTLLVCFEKHAVEQEYARR